MYLQESLQFGKKPDKITFFIYPTEVACHPPSTNLKCVCATSATRCHQIPFPFWVLLSLWLSTFDARKQLLKLSSRQKILQDESSPKNLNQKKVKKTTSCKLNHLLIIIFWSNYFGVNWSSVHHLPFVQQFKISAKRPRQPKNCQRRGAPWMPPRGSNKDIWKIDPFFHKESKSLRWYIALWLKSGKQKKGYSW